MSTCELDRFVIQTPYIKVLKSCSVPFVDRAGIDGDSDIDGHGWTDGTNERRWINAYSLFRVCARSGSLYPACQSRRKGALSVRK